MREALVHRRCHRRRVLAASLSTLVAAAAVAAVAFLAIPAVVGGRVFVAAGSRGRFGEVRVPIGVLARGAWQQLFGSSGGSGTEADEAIYAAWAAEFPKAAKAGKFLGAPAARADIANSAAMLRAVLGLSGSDVLDLVKEDGLVLFTGSESRTRAAFEQLEKELGGREGALDALRSQPGLLMAGPDELDGKGASLVAAARFAQVTRPAYKGVRGFFAPLVSSSRVREASDGSGIGGETGVAQQALRDDDPKQGARDFLNAFTPVFGPAALPLFFLLGSLSDQLNGGSGHMRATATNPSDLPAFQQMARGLLGLQ